MNLISTKTKLNIRKALSLLAKKTGKIDKKAEGANPPWKILMYHRVIDPREVPYLLEDGMYVRPDTFSMQMELLSKDYNVIGLDKLVELVLKGEKLEPRTVAVTLDDGWVDNHKYALPILEKFNIPATIFLATAYIGSDELFWTDKVAIALLNQSGDIFSILRDAGFQDLESVEEVIHALKQESVTNRSNTVGRLSKGLPKTKRQFLNWEEVKEMAEKGIVFGCHSHNHEFANALSEADLDADLSRNLDVLSASGLQSCSQVFCYPGGRYSKVTQRIVAKKMFNSCLAVHRHSDLKSTPAIFGRVGIHEDMTNTPSLFEARIYL